MPLIQDRSRSQLAFQLTGGDVDRFQVIRYRGTEGLCQLYRFEIELVTTDTQVAFDDVVGKAAVLSINTITEERWFHGIVSRFEMTNQTEGQTYFRVELVPGIWLLTHRYNSRIFQNKTVKDIISDVLTSAGFASDRFRFTLQGSYQPREYCVQYRETDHNFISRLMEEEGIWWYFEQTKDSHVLVMADSTAAYKPIDGDAKLPFVPPTGLSHEVEHVFRFRLGQAVRPGAVVLNDFNFKNPPLKLEVHGDGGRDAGLEFSDYPGEYVEQSAGTNLAKIRMEEFEASRTVGIGQSNSCRIATARTFELSEHPCDTLNVSYLLTTVTHQGKQATLRASTGGDGRSSILDGRVHQSLLAARNNENETIRELAEALLQIASRFKGGDATAHRALSHWMYHAGQVSRDLANVAAAAGSSPMEAISLRNLIEDVAQNSLIDYDAPVYECRFECIPAAVSFRPPRLTPWPVMRGTQTARVVGPQGEEIHTDEYGRVKVQFNWDRVGKFDDKSSCWIRVAQAMAGGNYGILFLPRVGQEVVVDFLEGDPDKPLIVGRVYNADQMPPYKLPDEKTKSVIKTQSSTGGGGTNEIRFEDLKDKEQLFLQAQRQMDTRVKADHFHTIGGSYHVQVGGDNKGEYRELVEKAKQVHVKGEVRTWTVGDESHKVDGKVSIQVQGTHSTGVGGDVVEKFDGNHKEDVAITFACKAGNGIKLEAGSGIELKCGGSSIVLTPSAIFIVGGPTVNINSGSGPPVSPPGCSATTPQTAEDPTAADSSQPGKDVRYSGGGELVSLAASAEVAGHEWEPEEAPEQEPGTWIDIELLDEEGLPVPSERYHVVDSKGKEYDGTLDSKGRARVLVAPGDCKVTYPNLDAEAWERTG